SSPSCLAPGSAYSAEADHVGPCQDLLQRQRNHLLGARSGGSWLPRPCPHLCRADAGCPCPRGLCAVVPVPEWAGNRISAPSQGGSPEKIGLPLGTWIPIGTLLTGLDLVALSHMAACRART